MIQIVEWPVIDHSAPFKLQNKIHGVCSLLMTETLLHFPEFLGSRCFNVTALKQFIRIKEGIFLNLDKKEGLWKEMSKDNDNKIMTERG